MSFKKTLGALAVGAVLAFSAISVAGCKKGDGLAEKMFDFGEDYYKSVSERYSLNYDEMIYDDFTGGIDSSRWVISDSVWDQWSTDQNGVRPQNVFLVNDGANPDTHLLLRANGSYYNMEDDKQYTEAEKAQYGNGKTLFAPSQGNGVNAGACLSTVEALGPGRYEVKMKPCPRVGALTSMWAYSWFTKNDGSVQQNEIDIEIGLQPNFSQVFFTTWTSPSNNTNMPTNVDYYVNDGNWHVYTFDWVVDAEVPYVDYFIDGVKVLTIDSNVPTTNATLNLGIWCPSWSGGGVVDPDNGNISTDSRMFDSDFAEISWWRYIPFQMNNWEQRPVQNRNFAEGYTPKTLDSVPQANKCANGDFERSDYGAYGNVWKDDTVTDTESSQYVENSKAEIVTEADNSYAKIENAGQLGQWLRGASKGFKYKLTGKFRTEGEAQAVFGYIHYLGYSVESPAVGYEDMVLGASSDWKDFTLEFTVDEDGLNDTQSIYYYLTNGTGKGVCCFDDLNLIYLGNN